MMPRTIAFLVGLLSLSSVLAISKRDAEGSNANNVEVAIIGGGASGTYAAVRLREDYNTSIVLIEPRARLGGSVSTYMVPETNTTLEYGVQSYLPYGPALAFFARFGISTEAFTSKRLLALNVDVESGSLLTGYIAPDINSTNEAFQRWLSIVAKYKSFLEPGYWNFPTPSDIPADFLVPFEDFATANRLEAAVPRIMLISGVGYGGIRNLLTFEVFQAFGPSLTKDMLHGTLFRPAGSNSLVYERAYGILKDNVLLSSSIDEVKRTSTGLKLSVKQGNTEYTVNARKVLYAAPPSLSNLAPFRLDKEETAVFSQCSEGGEYIGVAQIPCIPENSTVTFMPSTAVPSNHLALNDWPFNLRLDSTGPSGLGLFRVVFGANFTLSTDEFKHVVASNVRRLQDAGTVAGDCRVVFKDTSNHTRPKWDLSAAKLQNGFVQNLYALQGHRSVWYTGYAWAAPYSSTIWAYTDTVLPKLLADLRGDAAS